MNRQYSAVLLTVVGLLTVAAIAQEKEIVANVPHEFVAGGRSFPAGTYTITRVSPETQPGIRIRNNETPQDGAFLLPSSIGDPVPHPGLTFERIGNTYYLSRIATNAGVYTLRKPPAAASQLGPT